MSTDDEPSGKGTPGTSAPVAAAEAASEPPVAPSEQSNAPSGDESKPAASPSRPQSNGKSGTHHAHGSIGKLAIAALGVVYGDIGTSPLYALRECFHSEHGIHLVDHVVRDGREVIERSPFLEQDLLGLLSLFFWSMTLVVTIKYVFLITRADNEGEGGILALLALVLPKRGAAVIPGLVIAGLFGAALLYADGMLTPAISVLSAVEGLGGIRELQRPDGAHESYIADFIVPLSVVILVGLFWVQRRGTARVGAAFGPVMILWFTTLVAMGGYWILRNPHVLSAIWPGHAITFMVHNQLTGFFVLGSVVLCITGGEALYADMGHFGRRPIALSWTAFVWPALAINYFGQGAFLLEHPELHEDAFFSMVGESALIRVPLVLLATAATVIASQALISGAFSLTRQGIQLGYLPRLEIRHTSSEAEGQIYVPEVNGILMVACVALVVTFQNSSAMAAAYGIAVTGTMAITTVLFYLVAQRWWGSVRAAIVCFLMLMIDVAFFSANVVKIASGGWIPLAVAAAILTVMMTWKAGRQRVGDFLRKRSRPLDELIDEIDRRDPPRVKGTAVFMVSPTAQGSKPTSPPVLLHHFKHNQVMHEQVVLLSIHSEDVPVVPRSKRVEVTRLREGFFLVAAHYGFMQVPKVTDILRLCDDKGLRTERDSTSFFLGREKLVLTKNPGMARWRKSLFAFLARNARPASDFFTLPPDRVLEMGMQLEL